MEERVLALYDFASKQEFIYRTSKIREISGASALLAKLYDTFFKLMKDKTQYSVVSDLSAKFDVNHFDADAQALYNGGGSLMVLFASREVYLEFNRLASAYLLKNVPTLRMIACGVPFTGDFEKDRKALYDKNRVSKNRHPAYDLTAVTPMTQIDPMTFLPVVYKRSDKTGEVSLSADRYSKEKAYFKYAKSSDNDLENLEGWAAVIYIDGNSMGKKLMKCADSDYNKGVKKLRGFSEYVNKTFVEEPLARMKKIVASSEDKGFREVIGGGDEITVICNAKLALKLTEAYFAALDEINAKLNEDERNYACAGIAVFHAKSPFTIAYEIAEAACEEAKKRAHSKNGNYFDFYYCHAGITTDFETLRQREQSVSARPYSAEEARERFAKYTPLLQAAGRSNVKALGNAAQRSIAEYLFEAERVNGYLGGKGNLATGSKAAAEEMKIIYDMAEFYDLWFGKAGEANEKADEN